MAEQLSTYVGPSVRKVSPIVVACGPRALEPLLLDARGAGTLVHVPIVEGASIIALVLVNVVAVSVVTLLGVLPSRPAVIRFNVTSIILLVAVPHRGGSVSILALGGYMLRPGVIVRSRSRKIYVSGVR
jgi:hypothetical protein